MKTPNQKLKKLVRRLKHCNIGFVPNIIRKIRSAMLAGAELDVLKPEDKQFVLDWIRRI